MAELESWRQDQKPPVDEVKDPSNAGFKIIWGRVRTLGGGGGVVGVLAGAGLKTWGWGLAPWGTRLEKLEFVRRGAGIFGGEVKIPGGGASPPGLEGGILGHWVRSLGWVVVNP